MDFLRNGFISWYVFSNVRRADNWSLQNGLLLDVATFLSGLDRD